jgi:DNA-binding YbaB/EbfC family protein
VNPEDLGKMMEQAQAVQSKLAELQQELALRRYEGSSGGGMVTAVVSGGLRVLEVHIEPSLFEGGDREMIEDLTAAALNAAIQNAQSQVQAELQRASAGLALPDLFGGGTG